MIRLGVIMDPIGSIKITKDSTFAMLLEAQSRGWEIHYIEQGDVHLRDGRCLADMRDLHVQDDASSWFRFGDRCTAPLDELDVVLMRKDPPFNREYIYTTYMLERAEAHGAMVINRPQALRDVDEKLYTAWFPHCTPPTLVTSNAELIRQFLREQEAIILKPLGNMGGASIFKLELGDPNTNVIIETMTRHGERFIMAQRYIPEISAGDKRILMINGEPIPYALARIPAEGETRGNLAAGGTGVGVELTERDHWICEQVGPILREQGLVFVGLDVIGDYLTEINVTSPTCIRELDRIYGLNIAGELMDSIESLLA